MAKSNKFGTFGGVFTPSVLTILGVIMYLRLPWVVGNGGLWISLGIILAAHIISVTTGLSISSIATDKKVGAGGPYYIVSRSMGLPIGGTLGLALFIGLSFSISLYVIGFCESMLQTLEPYTGIEITKNAVRVAGTATIVMLTAITLISSAFAIKIQYVIMALIGASLVSILLGTGTASPETGPQLLAPEGGAGITTLFGIFFPAVTGFTAGVNMSGDLKDPKRSLPRGTLLAIGTGLIVYVGLAVFLAYRIDGDQLRNSQTVLQDMALFGPAVVAGIWGATLSSGIGSIMGAPRILQALSGDGVTPRFFAKGAGPSNEPRRALILAFLIGEAGILIGELDVIAAIVSMFFIATYGFLNLSCAIESWASTDFRPDFKIPRWVSVVGAITCFVIMIYLDLAAMLGATALFVACFFYLKRRELTLSSGDTWEGVWSSLVRLGLNHLARSEDASTYRWRPNVLALRTAGITERAALLDFGQVLIRDRGVLTDLALGVDDLDEARSREEIDGVFHRAVAVDQEDPFVEMRNAVRYSGFRGIEPNAILLDWSEHKRDGEGFLSLCDDLEKRELNLLVYHPGEDKRDAHARVDIWWHPERDSLALAMSLVRYLTSSHEYAGADVRFLFVNDDNTRADTLIRTTTRLLDDARMIARVQVLDNSLDAKPLEDWVERESADAALTILALPQNKDQLARTTATVKTLGPALLLRGAKEFRSSFGGGALARWSKSPHLDDKTPVGDGDDLPPVGSVPLTGHETLVDAVRPIALSHDEILRGFHERCLEPLYIRLAGVADRFSALIMKELTQLEKNLEKQSAPRHAKFLSGARGRFLHQARKTLDVFEQEDLPMLRDTLEGRLEAVREELDQLVVGLPKTVTAVRLREDFVLEESDDRAVRGAKRRLRWRAGIRGKRAKDKVPFLKVATHMVQVESRDLVSDIVQDAARDAYNATRHIGRTLEGLRRDLAELAQRSQEGIDPALVAERKDRALAELGQLADAHYARAKKSKARLVHGGRDLALNMFHDVNRIDAKAHAKKARRVYGPALAEVNAGLDAASRAFGKNQSALLRRVELQLVQAALQHRVRTVALKSATRVKTALNAGIEGEYVRILDSLAKLAETKSRTDTDDVKVPADIKVRTEPARIMEELQRDVERALADDLVTEAESVDDEAILRMEENPFEVVEPVTVPIERATRALLEAELMGPLEIALSRLADEEERAIGTVQDVSRLLSFHLSDATDEADDDESVANVETIYENAQARLQKGRDELSAAADAVRAAVDSGLRSLGDGTDALIHGGDERALRRGSGQVPRNRARRRILGAYETARTRASRTVVQGLYRWATGRVLQRQFHRPRATADAGAEGVLPMVDVCTPKDAVMTQLPFHYQQPFLSSGRAGADFFVGREREIASAKAAVSAWRKGARGALFVVGDRLSGKSALCRAILRKHLPKAKAIHLAAPAGGAGGVSTFDRRLATEIGARGTVDDVLRTLPEGSCVVLHDLELWWTRSDTGGEVVDHISRLIERHGERLFFVINMGRHAYRLLSRITRITERALTVVECGPMDAETLQEAVLQRHRTTGFVYELDGRTEQDLAAWTVARLFTRMFDYADGRVGAALLGWVAHIDRVSNNRIIMRPAKAPSTDPIGELSTDLLAIVVELLLHKQMTRPRLIEVTRMTPAGLSGALGTLMRSGLVTESNQGALEVNRFVDHIVAQHLIKQGVLS